MAKIDDGTKALFYGGMIIGTLLGLLGNIIVTLYFKIFDTGPAFDILAFILALGGFILVVYIAYYRFIKSVVCFKDS